jgi:hypothetical protein
MKKLFLLVLMALMGLNLVAQNVSVSKARFKQGDDMSWAKPEMDDASWSEIDVRRLCEVNVRGYKNISSIAYHYSPFNSLTFSSGGSR